MTLHYDFPYIQKYSDVEPHVANDPNFAVSVKKDFGIISVDYLTNGTEAFPHVVDDDAYATIRRECRGIKFDAESGAILARPYHKFFNCGERNMVVDLSKAHVILEKLDGSMVYPVLLDDELYWMTKAGVTDTADRVAHWVKCGKDSYEEFARKCIGSGITPIFEWCSNRDRIAVDHPVDRLILTAMRWNRTGRYVPYGDLVSVAEEASIEVVRQFVEFGTTTPTEEMLVEGVRNLHSQEGVVIRFDDGHMVKIKSEWYVNRHRAREAIERPISLLRLMVEPDGGGLDDVLPLLHPIDKAHVEEFQKKTSKELGEFYENVWDRIRFCKIQSLTKKDYSLSFSLDSSPVRSMVFACWGEDSYYTILAKIREYVYNNAGSPHAFKHIESIFPTTAGLQRKRVSFQLEG